MKLGGHNIPEEVIIRRYYRGIKNFFEIYSKISDYWIVIDNTFDISENIVEGEDDRAIKIINENKWKEFHNIWK